MNRPTEDRLDELFVRYWDDALTRAESEELGQLLTADLAARDRFHHLCLQAVIAAELPAPVRSVLSAQGPSTLLARKPRRWSRRRVLSYLGGGIAASAVGVLGKWYHSRPSSPGPRLTQTFGEVTLRSPGGDLVPLTGSLPLGGTVSTHGPTSWAVLSYNDKTSISLAGDSVASLGDNGLRLLLRQGTATADVARQPADAAPLTLATAEATLAGLNGVVMTLGRFLQGTVVGVNQGEVTVAMPTGQGSEVVRGGEILTVGSNGNCNKQWMGATPDQFAWDLTRPLPDRWHIGHREVTPEGPVVRPAFWFDPYHQSEMSQIRSDHQWAQGFFRLFPESVVRVRYWVDRPGPSQVVFCVRTGSPADPATGVLECNGAFAQARPGEWQWLEVKAQEMLNNIHAPKFGPPWVGFLLIFNTYKEDIGLKVARFQVTRSGGAVLPP